MKTDKSPSPEPLCAAGSTSGIDVADAVAMSTFVAVAVGVSLAEPAALAGAEAGGSAVPSSSGVAVLQ
jgi:hypothetical protein